MAERVRAREIDDDEGRRLVRIVRRGTVPVVTWRRAQMVLLPAILADCVPSFMYDTPASTRHVIIARACNSPVLRGC